MRELLLTEEEATVVAEVLRLEAAFAEQKLSEEPTNEVRRWVQVLWNAQAKVGAQGRTK